MNEIITRFTFVDSNTQNVLLDAIDIEFFKSRFEANKNIKLSINTFVFLDDKKWKIIDFVVMTTVSPMATPAFYQQEIHPYSCRIMVYLSDK